MEKTATPQAKPKNKHFWNFQPASGDNPPELILYGDIASETWWGDEVTPRQFTEELDALGAVPEIVVRINSGGGDVFAANAIYTRLKDNAAKITVKIDGWAASAATIIAMAGDSIEIPGNGVFMVHDPALGLLGYFNETELAKMTDELKVIKQSIVNAYTLKTGKDASPLGTFGHRRDLRGSASICVIFTVILFISPREQGSVRIISLSATMYSSKRKSFEKPFFYERKTKK